eukprot:3398959-Prymnesium_polylepis.2
MHTWQPRVERAASALGDGGLPSCIPILHKKGFEELREEAEYRTAEPSTACRPHTASMLAVLLTLHLVSGDHAQGWSCSNVPRLKR